MSNIWKIITTIKVVVIVYNLVSINLENMNGKVLYFWITNTIKGYVIDMLL